MARPPSVHSTVSTHGPRKFVPTKIVQMRITGKPVQRCRLRSQDWGKSAPFMEGTHGPSGEEQLEWEEEAKGEGGERQGTPRPFFHAPILPCIQSTYVEQTAGSLHSPTASHSSSSPGMPVSVIARTSRYLSSSSSESRPISCTTVRTLLRSFAAFFATSLALS